MNTNTVETISSNIQGQANETLNSVLLDILKGVSGAGKELYGASKTAIGQSVDFVMEQAPLVVQEFLTWKFWESTATVIFLTLIVVGIYFIYRKICKLCVDDCDYFSRGISAIVAIFISIMIFGAGIIPHFKTALKVKVAPRVYIIEYVTDTIKSETSSNSRR